MKKSTERFHPFGDHADGRDFLVVDAHRDDANATLFGRMKPTVCLEIEKVTRDANDLEMLVQGSPASGRMTQLRL